MSVSSVRLSSALTVMVFGMMCSEASYAQHPDVHEEPYHVPFYEWDCLRFLNVRAKPGDTTAYHVHRNPILYLTMQGAEVWLDDVGQKPRTVPLPDGWVGSDSYSDGDTLLHRFAVRGADALHIVAVERIGTCKAQFEKPLMDPFYRDKGFAVYAIDWEEYMRSAFYKQFPVIVPPHPIRREGWVKYSAGHVLKPVPMDADYAHVAGVEVLWVVLPHF